MFFVLRINRILLQEQNWRFGFCENRVFRKLPITLGITLAITLAMTLVMTLATGLASKSGHPEFYRSDLNEAKHRLAGTEFDM
jgi:hypothetical protein